MLLISNSRGILARTSAISLVTLWLWACGGSSGGSGDLGVGGSESDTGGTSSATTAGTLQGGAQSGTGGTLARDTGGAAASTGGSAASPTGGANTVGGAATGGRVSTGGTVAGGAATGGRSSTGFATGGAAVGGAATGGNSATGVATGGAAVGGAATGGNSATGVATGGAAVGGAATGGKSAAGGAATGGAAVGGAATGGKSATGGAATGGAATGGASSSSSDIWISPSGADGNPGTKASPMFTFCDTSAKVGACYKLCPSGGTCKGGTIWAMTGTYSYSVTQKTGSTMTGTASAPLNLLADSGATPVFDFTGMAVDSANRGIQIAGTYWHIKGITVTKAGDTGIFVMGANITVEQCIAHHNADAGIVIGVNSNQSGSGMNNLILNCDSYQNNDSQNGGENADGFGMKENSGTGNVFRGCRAWDNSDDGWDLYGWASPVTIDNCWAISQCKSTKGSNSDGNGFKLGGNDVSAKHILSNLYSTDNSYGSSGRGFTNNSNPAAMSCSNCASWSNKAADQGVSGVSTSAPGSATAAKMIAAKRNADGSLPSISSL
jgi:pectate disaccharide-lyase